MRKIVFAAISTLILFSCRTPRYSYAPTRVNTPLFKEKKEIQLDGSISVLRGFDASAAYAISSHVGLTLNASWRNDKQEGSDGTGELLPPELIQYSRRSVDFGVGYFTRINPGNWHFEVFGGFGKGKFSIKDNGKINSTSYSRYYDSKLDRIFIQPAIGFNGTTTQFIFFMRFQMQQYNDVQTDYSNHELEYYSIAPASRKFYPFIEPGITFRYYIPSLPVGFESNLLFSAPSSGTITTIPIHFSIGIHGRFAGAAK